MESEALQSSVDSCITDITEPVDRVLVQRVQNALKKTINCDRYEGGLKALCAICQLFRTYTFTGWPYGST